MQVEETLMAIIRIGKRKQMLATVVLLVLIMAVVICINHKSEKAPEKLPAVPVDIVFQKLQNSQETRKIVMPTANNDWYRRSTPQISGNLLDNHLYSMVFLNHHREFAADVVNFCSIHSVSTHYALTNCDNAASAQNVISRVIDKVALGNEQLERIILWFVVILLGMWVSGFAVIIIGNLLCCF